MLGAASDFLWGRRCPALRLARCQVCVRLFPAAGTGQTPRPWPWSRDALPRECPSSGAQEAARTAERLQHAVRARMLPPFLPREGAAPVVLNLNLSGSLSHIHPRTLGEFCTENKSQIRKMTAVPESRP